MKNKSSNYIKKIRSGLKLDQGAFCKKTNISQSQLSKLENGKVGMSIDTIFKLNKHLKISSDSLLKEYGKSLKKVG